MVLLVFSSDGREADLADCAGGLADLQRGLAGDGDRTTELAGRVPRRHDAVIADAHGTADDTEVGVAVVDADEQHDVHLTALEVTHQRGHVVFRVLRCVVGTVADDGGCGAHRHAVGRELLSLGHNPTEHGDDRVVQGRVSEVGRVEPGVELGDVLQRDVAMDGLRVERPCSHQDAVGLLAAAERVDHQAVCIASVLRHPAHAD